MRANNINQQSASAWAMFPAQTRHCLVSAGSPCPRNLILFPELGPLSFWKLSITANPCILQWKTKEKKCWKEAKSAVGEEKFCPLGLFMS